MQMSISFLLIILAQITTSNDNIPDNNKQSSDNRPRIIGGSTATIGEIPYLVSIRWRDRVDAYGGHICGGSLISRRTVLTAAHCCFKDKVKRPLKVFLLVMGNTYVDKNISTQLKYSLAGIRIHQCYSDSNYQNDVAVMFIDGFVPYSSFVRPIEINNRPIKLNTMCRVSGWGEINFGVRTTELHSAQVPILHNDECKSDFPIIVPSQICAGNTIKEVGFCSGDSGGPLECKNVLVGIVSYSIQCGWYEHPSVYQSVLHFNDWIKKQNNSHNQPRLSKSIAVALAFFGRCWHCFSLLVAISLYDAAY